MAEKKLKSKDLTVADAKKAMRRLDTTRELYVFTIGDTRVSIINLYNEIKERKLAQKKKEEAKAKGVVRRRTTRTTRRPAINTTVIKNVEIKEAPIEEPKVVVEKLEDIEISPLAKKKERKTIIEEVKEKEAKKKDKSKKKSKKDKSSKKDTKKDSKKYNKKESNKKKDTKKAKKAEVVKDSKKKESKKKESKKKDKSKKKKK